MEKKWRWMMIYMYTRRKFRSLCVFSRVRRRQACLPPKSIKNPIYPNSKRKSLSRIKKSHQTTSFFFFKSPISISISNSPFPLLPLTLPFLPTSNSSRIFKYTSSTNPLFSAAAASSSRIPRIPGPAQGNVKKEFRRWM